MEIPGLHAVVPTVFHDDGTLDLDGTAAVVEAYAEAGAVGIVALGVMGEGHLLDDGERARVAKLVRHVSAGLTLTVGLGAPGEGQVQSAGEAIDAGADAVLVGLGPEEQRAPLLHRVADLGAPVIVQDHPAATGIHVRRDEVVSLARDVEAVAVKAEAPPTPDLVAAIVASGSVAALGGLSALFLLEELEAGSVGAMTGVAVPERLVQTLRRWGRDDRAGTRDAYLSASAYLRLEAMSGTTGLVVRKEAWRQRGVIASSRVRQGEPLGITTKRAITRRLRDAGVEAPAGLPDA
ncbi:MAG: dihydrodipicolinate synthase family protein [Actinobacteria bacterium]|nr:dihydrodipicolinate synthase family protein [Actinomycetota bacterium]